MKYKFMFSAGMNPLHQKVLTGLLALIEKVDYKKVILVETEDPNVAGLLLSLDTAEQIDAAAEQALAAAKDIDVRHPIDDKPKVRKPRKPYSGPLVECSKCHTKKAPFHITKTGVCKVCHMRELRAAKSQQSEKSHGGWGSGMPQSDGHHQENLANIQAKPKEKIKLDKLAGVKVG
jgi:hypothetical protein